MDSIAKKMRRMFNYDYFEVLPDHLIIDILSKVLSSASTSFSNILLTCKRFKQLARHDLVLAQASINVFSIRAKKWSKDYHIFLVSCVKVGNLDACYFLGMIRYYCLMQLLNGISLLSSAAARSHAAATYSLAMICLNGGIDLRHGRDIERGLELCTRADVLGHVHASFELGVCLMEGYGIKKNEAEGLRLVDKSLSAFQSFPPIYMRLMWPDVVHRFLREWSMIERRMLKSLLLKFCSYIPCGRWETKPFEFRSCSNCGKIYCSHACAWLDGHFHDTTVTVLKYRILNKRNGSKA